MYSTLPDLIRRENQITTRVGCTLLCYKYDDSFAQLALMFQLGPLKEDLTHRQMNNFGDFSIKLVRPT